MSISRVLAALLALAVLVVLTAACGLFWLGKRAEPVYDGEVALAGLTAPVSVRFGPHAVPSIAAESIDDLLYAQGYVVASERLWQMDLLRRLAGGRLAEVFGEAALPADRFYRTMGLPLAAREAYAALEPEYRRMLERYADGINAYRRAALERPPLEYVIAGFDPAPWAPEDSLVIGEYMAWINSVNLREELIFLRLAGRLGNRLALELFPADVGIPAPAQAAQLPDYRALAAAVAVPEPTRGLAARLPVCAAPAPGIGASNVWAVNGPRGEGGHALVANDPHLAPSTPGIWYELELSAPGYHAAGVALPGVPLILIGHNQDLAWGMTTVTADTRDLFLERMTGDGDQVMRAGGGSEPIQRRVEPIPVKGLADPVELIIERISHGVLIDDLVQARVANPEGLAAVALRERLALRRNLEVPERALVGLWRLGIATTVDQARAAGADLRHVSQNLVVAHRDGSIGWQVTGMLPLRGRGSGTFPVPGWEPGYGWTDYLPFTSNPGVTNPAAHQLVNANNRSVPEDAPVQIGHSWLPPYRAQRIEELLDGAEVMNAEQFAQMQADRESVRARLFMASLRRALPAMRVKHPGAALIAERQLLSWSGDFAPDSRPAALYGLLLPALYRALYADELGDDLRLLMSIDFTSYGPLDEALRTDRSSFWDDINTANVAEGPADTWARALRAADAELQDILPEGDEQRLDRLRTLTFPHAFDGQPVLGDLFNIGPIGMGGDSATVNVANASPLAPRQIGYTPPYAWSTHPRTGPALAARCRSASPDTVCLATAATSSTTGLPVTATPGPGTGRRLMT